MLAVIQQDGLPAWTVRQTEVNRMYCGGRVLVSGGLLATFDLFGQCVLDAGSAVS